ncbi:MAG: hypothetical protein ABIH04_01885 [Planctomycetota bacterium]
MAAKKPNLLTKNPEVILAVIAVAVFVAVCIITLTSIESTSPVERNKVMNDYELWYKRKTQREIKIPEARDYKNIFDKYIIPGDPSRIPRLEKWLFYRRPSVQIERKNVLAYFLGKIKVTAEPDFGKITVRITLEDLDTKYKIARDPMTLKEQEYDHVDDDNVTVRLYGGRMAQDKIEWNQNPYIPRKSGRGEWIFEDEIKTSGAEERFYWAEAEAEFPDAKKIGNSEYEDGTTVIPPTKVVVAAPQDDPETPGRVLTTEYVRAETKRIFSLKLDFSTGNKISIKVINNREGETSVTKPLPAGEMIDGTDFQILNIVTIDPESRVIVNDQGNIEQIRIMLKVYNAASPDNKMTVTVSEFNDPLLTPRSDDKMIEAATEKLRKEFEKIGTDNARFHPRRDLMKDILKLAARLSLKNLREPKELKDALNNPIPAYKQPAGPWQNRAMLVREFNDLSGENKATETVIVYIAPKDVEEKNTIQYYVLHRKQGRKKTNDTIIGPYEYVLEAEYGSERTVDNLFEIVKNDIGEKIGDVTLENIKNQLRPKTELTSAGNAKSRATAFYPLDKLTGQPAGPYLHYFDNKEEKPYIDIVPSEAVEPEAPPPFVPGEKTALLNALDKKININITKIDPKNIFEHIDYLAGLWKLKDKIIIDKSVQDIDDITGIKFSLSLQSPETTGKQLLDQIIKTLNDQLKKADKPYNIIYVVNGKIVIKVESP